jgi:hypothetical protein
MDTFRPEEIQDIAPAELPELVAQYFIVRAAYLGHDSVSGLADFDRLMKLDVLGQYAIFFAVAERTYSVSPAQTTTDRLIYAADVLPDEQIAGLAEVSFSLTPHNQYSRNKPLVLNIENKIHQLGYGRRRYLALNAASRALFGYPLNSRERNSEDMLSVQARVRWNKFVNEGLAEVYDDQTADGLSVQRYRFII